LLNVLDRKAAWRDPEMVRFVGLQDKCSIEAHFDPELNSLFHAFDALGHREALDCSPAFERHRRYQSARHRELLRTLEAYRKMRNAECGMRITRMTNGKWQMANAGWRMTQAGWRMIEGR